MGINIGFYLLLKARQTSVKDHPVIGKLVQYRKLIKELEPLDKKLDPEIQMLLQRQGSTNENGSATEEDFQLGDTSQKPKLSALLDDDNRRVSFELKHGRGHLTKKTGKRKSEQQEETKGH